MTTALVAFAFLIALGFSGQQQEERPKVPKDSVLVTVTGCLKGRALSAADVRQEDTQSGPIVRNRAFRLAGKKELMNEVKADNGQRVMVTGLIKKSALAEPGQKFRGGRNAVGGGSTAAPGSASSLPDPADNVVVMDVTDVQALGGSCGG
jgi:hypothetical protein